jgi:hypothetical protein
MGPNKEERQSREDLEKKEEADALRMIDTPLK